MMVLRRVFSLPAVPNNRDNFLKGLHAVMKETSSNKRKKSTPAILVGIIGGIIVISIFTVGTVILGGTAHSDTGKAVRSVSSFYLDELAGRREQVVASNLQREIEDLQVAVGLLTEDDLSDTEHLQAFQARLLEEEKRRTRQDNMITAMSADYRSVYYVDLEIIKMILQSRGMETDLAPNGKIAVDKFSASEPGYYSAILMDMRMPEMDGLTATKIIRGIDREDACSIPIIALTAYAFDEDVQRSLQSGLNAHLTKPIKPELLFETLESYL